jgi:hypothetical protein
MALIKDIQRAICGLFEVHEDELGVQRIVTPLEYPGSNDRVVVRVRPRDHHYQVDENGEACLFARLSGGETDSDIVTRFFSGDDSPAHVTLSKDESLTLQVHDASQLATAIFRVACAAQQLYALATSHQERESSDFKAKVEEVVVAVCRELDMPVQHGVMLPISGDLQADHLIGHDDKPLIVIAATSTKRLLEAELIHMQYRFMNKPGFVLAVAESQKTVGVKQFNRANYYTGKTVQYNPMDFSNLLRSEIRH